MSFVAGIVLTAYASLLIELTVFPIPSEASTYNLLATQGDPGSAGDALIRARSLHRARKLLVFLLPTMLGVALFLLPPLAVLCVPGFGFLQASTTPALNLLGITLVILGRVTTFVSVLQLRATQRRGGLPAGLFLHSRNPGLVGMFTLYLGLCCLFPHWLLLVGLPLYVANMTRRVMLEEASLLARHGAAWQHYKKTVPRYLGWRAQNNAHPTHG
ncbi:hypothetical protein LBMAG49_22160 [Planctomycetota bacterium]|nr:isoprenylcysteine carboxylmethyltransferase family protein [Planctomycetota bacterium]GDY02887.1 hypothetical protein LBMAG49_22160 [Planctomycetota bacterium]